MPHFWLWRLPSGGIKKRHSHTLQWTTLRAQIRPRNTEKMNEMKATHTVDTFSSEKNVCHQNNVIL